MAAIGGVTDIREARTRSGPGTKRTDGRNAGAAERGSIRSNNSHRRVSLSPVRRDYLTNPPYLGTNRR